MFLFYQPLMVTNQPQWTSYQLWAANNTPIATYGERLLSLNFGLRRDFTWVFTIADVSTPILGVDFLGYFGLLIDIKNQRLLDSITLLSVLGFLQHCDQPSVLTFKCDSDFARILQAFPDITKSTTRCEPKIQHKTEHVIETTGPPVAAKARRLPPDKLKAAKLAFQTMLSSGKARPSKSPWSSPIHMVAKGARDWRICGNYRALNARTRPDRYPVPNIQDFNRSSLGRPYLPN